MLSFFLTFLVALTTHGGLHMRADMPTTRAATVAHPVSRMDTAGGGIVK